MLLWGWRTRDGYLKMANYVNNDMVGSWNQMKKRSTSTQFRRLHVRIFLHIPGEGSMLVWFEIVKVTNVTSQSIRGRLTNTISSRDPQKNDLEQVTVLHDYTMCWFQCQIFCPLFCCCSPQGSQMEMMMNTIKNTDGEILTGRLWRKDHPFFKFFPFYTNIPRMDEIGAPLQKALGGRSQEGCYGALLVVRRLSISCHH